MLDDPNTNNRRQNSRGSPFRSVLLLIAICVGIALAILTSLPLLKNFEAFGSKANSLLNRTRPDVLLYASPATSQYFLKSGGNYEQLLNPWIKYLSARRLNFKQIDNLAVLGENPSATLVLASAVALSQAERETIMRHQAAGGSVLSTWATGTWDQNGQWAGWGFLKDLGAEFAGETTTQELGFLIVRGQTPITTDIPAGERIALSGLRESIVRFKDPQAAAVRLLNWDRIAKESAPDDGVVLFKDPSGRSGRVVIFGFPETAWSSTEQALYQLIDGSLQWLDRQPLIARAAWPEAKKAAQSISMDTEEGFLNSLAFADLLIDKKLPATFFVLTSVAKQYPEALARLATHFELGMHGDIHTGFKGQSAKAQADRIGAMQTDIQQALPQHPPVKGFRPPLEEYDATTEQTLVKNDFLYEVVDPLRSQSRLPFFAKTNVANKADLVVLPRTQRDDLNLLSQASAEPLQERKKILQMLEQDLDMVLDNGALGVLSIHSQNFGPDSPLVSALPLFFDTLVSNKDLLWVATAGEIAEWWADRSRVALKTVARGPTVDVEVTISGKQPVSKFALIVMTPIRGKPPRVESLKVGLPKPEIVALDPLRYRILFPTLKSGNYSYNVSF
ncbi:MAG: polysaccharide deacetylase family protein [Zwartia sp.]